MEFNIFKKKDRQPESTTEQQEQRSTADTWRNPIYGTYTIDSLNTFNNSKALKISAFNRGVNLIANSVSSLPVIVYKYRDKGKGWKDNDFTNPLYNILNIAPNWYQNKVTFYKQLIYNKILKGNAYILIQRNKDLSCNNLQHLNPDLITVEIRENKKVYVNSLDGKPYDDADIIHIINYSTDGFKGQSTLEYACDTLDIAYQSDQHTKNWFSGGGSMAGILAPKQGVNVTKDKAQQAKTAIVNNLDNNVQGKSNSIILLDSGMEYQSISTNPRESQLLESRQFNVLDIARFLNIPPSLLFDQSAKYSTVEQQQLDYLQNCITPILEEIEAEFLKKLFSKIEWVEYEIRFDTKGLLRSDLASLGTYYKTMIEIGVYSPNEVAELVGASNPAVGGNEKFISTNLQKLSAPVVVNQKDNVDNKLK